MPELEPEIWVPVPQPCLVVSAAVSALVGLVFDSWLGFTTSLQIDTEAFLPGVRCAEELQEPFRPEVSYHPGFGPPLIVNK